MIETLGSKISYHCRIFVPLMAYLKIGKILILGVSLSISSVFWTGSVSAQDPQFSQFYANPLYLNPAFAGSGKCPRVILNYRNQWPGIETGFRTQSFSYDQYIKLLSGGIGLMVNNDRAGIGNLTSTNISGIYSYNLPISRSWSLKAGIEASYLQKTIDWGRVTFNDMIDPHQGFIYGSDDIPNSSPVRKLNIASGILAFSKNIYFGAAVHHLTQPNISLTQSESALPRKLTFHGGAMIPFNKNKRNSENFFSPNLMFIQQGQFQQVMVGLYANKGPLVGGMWYRQTSKNTESLILLLGIQHNIFKFGYSYDFTLSALNLNRTYGAHEISLGIQFFCNQNKNKNRTINCPSF
jgi:type IX secretion system PorP/SprF family membrane protein